MCQRYALENRVAACASDAPMPCIIHGLRCRASYFFTFGCKPEGFCSVEDAGNDSRKDHYQKRGALARRWKTGARRVVNARKGHFLARWRPSILAKYIYMGAALRRLWRDCVAFSRISRFPPLPITRIYLIYVIYVITCFEGCPPSPCHAPLPHGYYIAPYYPGLGSYIAPSLWPCGG